MRKYKVTNYITGRWVCTVKRDKDGNFQKCKARWVLRGFQDAQHWDLQTDSPTSTRPGFRLQCQAAANYNYDLSHIDLKTAFLQGETFDSTREVICQLPPEAGQPKYMAARLKRAAYGLNDAPRLWWNRLDAKLRSYGLKPTRADRCCYVLYSPVKKKTGLTPRKKTCFADEITGWEANLAESSPSSQNFDSRKPEIAIWEANFGSSRRSATRPATRPTRPTLSHADLDSVTLHSTIS